jgi:hypothetical protein
LFWPAWIALFLVGLGWLFVRWGLNAETVGADVAIGLVAGSFAFDPCCVELGAGLG